MYVARTVLCLCICESQRLMAKMSSFKALCADCESKMKQQHNQWILLSQTSRCDLQITHCVQSTLARLNAHTDITLQIAH